MTTVSCVENGRIGEAEFVEIYCDRQRPSARCAGARHTKSFVPWRLADIEDAIGTGLMHGVLWSNFEPWHTGRLTFTLCALHWMDLATAVTIGAYLFGQTLWIDEAVRLIRDTCHGVGWDLKEISNMFVWQRVPLT